MANCKSGKYEEWYKYDKNGNMIYSKSSSGLECTRTYDEKGNEIYFKNSKGREEWKEYDENNNLIYEKIK